MKKLLLLFISFFVFWGCEDEKEVSGKNPLIGVYNMVNISIEIQNTPSQTISYNNDGTENYGILILGEGGVCSVQGKIENEYGSGSGSWSDTGNKLTMITTDGETVIFDFLISDDLLNLSFSYPGSNDDDYGYLVTCQFMRESI